MTFNFIVGRSGEMKIEGIAPPRSRNVGWSSQRLTVLSNPAPLPSGGAAVKGFLESNLSQKFGDEWDQIVHISNGDILKVLSSGSDAIKGRIIRKYKPLMSDSLYKTLNEIVDRYDSLAPYLKKVNDSAFKNQMTQYDMLAPLVGAQQFPSADEGIQTESAPNFVTDPVRSRIPAQNPLVGGARVQNHQLEYQPSSGDAYSILQGQFHQDIAPVLADESGVLPPISSGSAPDAMELPTAQTRLPEIIPREMKPHSIEDEEEEKKSKSVPAHKAGSVLASSKPSRSYILGKSKPSLIELVNKLKLGPNGRDYSKTTKVQVDKLQNILFRHYGI